MSFLVRRDPKNSDTGMSKRWLALALRYWNIICLNKCVHYKQGL